MAKLQPVGMTEDELEDAFVDWYFGEGYDIHSDLESKGYTHQYLGQDISQRDLRDIGPYALVVDEFPLGDLLYVKKIGPVFKIQKELGLTPILRHTVRAAKTARVLSEFGDDEMIELIDTHEIKGAVLHGSRTHWHQAAVVHPCARPSCKWQGSVFDEFGPVTHVEAETKEDAVKELFEYNSHWEPHRGAVDEVFTQMEEFKYPMHRNPPPSLTPTMQEALNAIYADSSIMRRGFVIWETGFPVQAGGTSISLPTLKALAKRGYLKLNKDASGRSTYSGRQVPSFGQLYSEVGSSTVLHFDIIPKSNPPFSGWREDWWLEKHPRDNTKIAYRRKRDALNVFMDWNQRLIDLAFNGPSQEHPPDSFDNFNHKYDLKGRRKINTFAKALWFAMPVGGPYYLENIDVNMLNETSPMRHNAEEGQLTIPDFAEERRLVDLEAAYWQDKYGDIFPEEEEELDEAPF